MTVIENDIIPFRGFTAINLFGVLFVRRDLVARLTPKVLNHERIHSHQIYNLWLLSLLFLLPLSALCWWLPLLSPLTFYIMYVLEWAIRLIHSGSTHAAYRSIGFEREAYRNQERMSYRPSCFSFLKYVRE